MPAAWTAAGPSTAAPAADGGVTVRGQSPAQPWPPSGYSGGELPGGYPRSPQPVSGGAPATTSPAYDPYGTSRPPAAPYGAAPSGAAPYGGGAYPQQPTYAYQQPGNVLPGPPLPPPPAEALPGTFSPFTPGYPTFQPPTNIPPDVVATPTPLDIYVEEARTGQFMFGVAVNSNNGVTGQITISERNFDITRFPTSWDDLISGTAWRGAGQGFRIEAQPGNQLQRYLVSFTEPYFLDTNVSFNASAFYMDRGYFDWTESRYGGRLGWGYRLTPDLSVSTSLRAEDVNIFNPRVVGVPDLDRVLGHSEVYSGRVSITHDTRDLPFMPTQGQLIELSYEQVFGRFDYPRGDISYSRYFMVRERPDGTGRHTLAFLSKVGFSGNDTPIFENYFAGGFSTLRGYAFRGASPIDMGVRVGGQFQFLNSLEYYFPLTADEMIRGTVFCDFGTVERDIALHSSNFRVAPGVGLRINVPALGPAPLAFDFAFPVASAAGDDEQTFSFFFGAMR
jgi:outer membrane protein insertion porin family